MMPGDVLYSQDSRIKGLPYEDQPFFQVPQNYAKQIAALVGDACMVVHNPRSIFVGDPNAPVFSDACIDEVMQGLQVQLDREGLSRTAGTITCLNHKVHHTEWYTLAEQLPRSRQRALVERIYAVYRQWVADGNSIPVYREGDRLPK